MSELELPDVLSIFQQRCDDTAFACERAERLESVFFTFFGV